MDSYACIFKPNQGCMCSWKEFLEMIKLTNALDSLASKVFYDHFQASPMLARALMSCSCSPAFRVPSLGFGLQWSSLSEFHGLHRAYSRISASLLSVTSLMFQRMHEPLLAYVGIMCIFGRHSSIIGWCWCRIVAFSTFHGSKMLAQLNISAK